MAVTDNPARYQEIAREFARGEGGVIALTPPTGNTSDASGYDLWVYAGSTKGGNDITGLTVAVNATTTRIDVTVPGATTLQVVPATTPSLALGPVPLAWIYVTVGRTTGGVKTVLSRFAIPVYEPEGTL